MARHGVDDFTLKASIEIIQRKYIVIYDFAHKQHVFIIIDIQGKVNPVLKATSAPWERTTDFASKVPSDVDFIAEVKVRY